MKAAKKSKAPSKLPKKTTAKTPANTVIPAIRVLQGSHAFYLFSLEASKLYRLVQINRRSEDKREGYQRALSPSRVRAISRYIVSGGVIPGAVVVSFDAGEFHSPSRQLRLTGNENIGWVIDGQHRLRFLPANANNGHEGIATVVLLAGWNNEDRIIVRHAIPSAARERQQRLARDWFWQIIHYSVLPSRRRPSAHIPFRREHALRPNLCLELPQFIEAGNQIGP